MKTKTLILTLALCCASEAGAQVVGKPGVGVIVGRPTGLTAKYYSSSLLAFDFGLGFSGDFAVYGDALWHAWDLFGRPAKGKLGGYFGFGPRFETERREAFEVRTVAGVAYWAPRHPVELFFELGPVFRLSPSHRVQLDAGAGVRVYFGAAAQTGT